MQFSSIHSVNTYLSGILCVINVQETVTQKEDRPDFSLIGTYSDIEKNR